MMLTIVAIVLVLGGLIFFHELGHFLAARLQGMGVAVFSLGFGPKLLSTRRGKTEYRLSAIPLGGYVSLVGEDAGEALPEGFTPKESFSERPAWQRFLVVLAGPLFNILLAWLLCWGLAWHMGEARLLPQLGAVEQAGPAEKAGLRSGDIVLSVNETPIGSWKELADNITGSGGKDLVITVERDARAQTFTVTPRTIVRKNIFGEDTPLWQIGIRSSGKAEYTPLDFLAAAAAGARQTWEITSLTWQGIVKLFQRVVPLDQVGGPIMIAQMVGEQAHQGLANVLLLTALISVNLGILNILPIPVLDGGHLLFLGLEMLFRRPLPRRIQMITMKIGLFLLIALMILATSNDLWRLFKGFAQ